MLCVASMSELMMYAPGMIMANVGMPSPPMHVGSAISALVSPDFTLGSPRSLSSWSNMAASMPRTYASDAESGPVVVGNDDDDDAHEDRGSRWPSLSMCDWIMVE